MIGLISPLMIVVVLLSPPGAAVLGETKEAPAVEPLIEDLRDKSWQFRWYAAEALGGIKDPGAVEPLITALRDKNVYVRAMAAWALGEIKDPRAVGPLMTAMKDEIKDVRRQASLALGKITGKDFGQEPAKWEAWWEKNKGR